MISFSPLKRIFLFLFLLPGALCAQLCPGSFDLRTQADVDSFSCETVTEELAISRQVTDLSPLIGLKSVGSLRINNTYNLTSLDGLDSLHTIEGELEIYQNDELLDFNGLRSLRQVQEIKVLNNDELRHIDGLAQVQGTLSRLTIERNKRLLQLDGLVGIDQVTTDLEILSNTALQQVDGLRHVQKCEVFSLIGSPDIIQLDSLAGLQVTKRISLKATGLQTIRGFNRTESLDFLEILSNTDIYSIAGFSHLRQLKVLTINFTNLNSLAGLDSLEGRMISLTLNGMSLLSDLGALHKLTGIERLTLDDIPRLSSLSGLEQLETVHELKLEKLSITDLAPLAGLTALSEELSLRENPLLTSLTGLSQLQQIGEDNPFISIRINRNPLLKDLDGLSGLRGTHEGGIKIIRNEGLESIEGLSNLSEVKGEIDIQYNPKLNQCCFLRKFLPPGNMTLAENDSPCNLNSNPPYYGICEVPIDTLPPVPFVPFTQLDTTRHLISPAFPNPNRGVFSVYFSNPDGSKMRLEVSDATGRKLNFPTYIPLDLPYGKHELDFSQLAPGTYFIRLSHPVVGQAHKLVIW